MFERFQERKIFGKSVEDLNNRWSHLTWRLDLYSTPFLLLTGHPILAGISVASYLWSRHSIREYKRKHNIPLEQSDKLYDWFNPNKDVQIKFWPTQRMAHATA